MQFAAVVETRKRLGLNENSGLEGAMRKSVHAIEARLKDFDEPRLTVLMLMMRRHEKDFMLRRDPQIRRGILPSAPMNSPRRWRRSR